MWLGLLLGLLFLNERRMERRNERKDRGVKRVKTGAFGERRKERKT